MKVQTQIIKQFKTKQHILKHNIKNLYINLNTIKEIFTKFKEYCYL